MKKIVSAILVVMTCAISGCMAEPMDTAEIESELSAEARSISMDSDDVVAEETNATGGCPSNYRTLIAKYYWTTKPLCNTQPFVQCAIERLTDPQTPCRYLGCADYVYYCDPDISF